MNTNSFNVLNSYQYENTILTALGSLLDFYTEKHGKNLVVRFDLHYPVCYNKATCNQDISRTMAKIVQHYKREGADPYYMWVREQETSNHPHYHCLLLLNGNKFKSYTPVFEIAKTCWGNTLGVDSKGLVNHCTKNKKGRAHENGIMLRRCDDNYSERCAEVQRQTSYLAKVDGKGEYKDGLRDFGMSRLK